jgi:hypothetical protein
MDVNANVLPRQTIMPKPLHQHISHRLISRIAHALTTQSSNLSCMSDALKTDSALYAFSMSQSTGIGEVMQIGTDAFTAEWRLTCSSIASIEELCRETVTS